MKMTGIELVESLQAWKETIILPRWIMDDVKALVRELEHFQRFREYLRVMGGIDVDFAWEETALESGEEQQDE